MGARALRQSRHDKEEEHWAGTILDTHLSSVKRVAFMHSCVRIFRDRCAILLRKMGNNNIYKPVLDATTGAPLSFVLALLAVTFVAVKLTSVSAVQPILNLALTHPPS